ncbi:chromatin modification-related protein EAF1 B-like isoform X2 [Andrographis paniculata]|uniref:chromatin modification-related protein EAF1 B-like isoform X2 n=1 Tax=Andrographis paniculata TaxID=175694 RepID=UPI0021E89FA3|nr:chromatin modification-related protein EAF1 B-like isoform X2 [Andrographis paniculata]
MGEVNEGGIGITDKTSPRRAAIEKVQVELRQQYDFREKRQRELEFLENGGDPLEYFKDRNTFSLSVQSTSFTGQHPEQYVSEAKGSFALTASPHGDSVESSGRLGAIPCEPNSADNLMLLEAERTFSEGNINSSHPRKGDTLLSAKLAQVDKKQRTQESGDSAAFCIPRQAYKRRNRSRPNRDGTRSSSTSANPTCGDHGSSLPSLHGPTEVKKSISDAENQKTPSNCSNKSTTAADDAFQNIESTENKQDKSVDGRAAESTSHLIESVPTGLASGAIASATALDGQHNPQSGDLIISTQVESDAPEAIQAMEEVTYSVSECQQSVLAANVDNLPSSCDMNGFGTQMEGMDNDSTNSSSLRVIKGLDSASPYPPTSLTVDGNSNNELCTITRKIDSDGMIKDQTGVPDGTLVVQGDEFVQEKETNGVDSSTLVKLEGNHSCKGLEENGFKILVGEAVCYSGSASKNEVKDKVVRGGMEPSETTLSESGGKTSEVLENKHGSHNGSTFSVKPLDSPDITIPGLHDGGTPSQPPQKSSGPDSVDEESILKEARIIEAKRRRIMELSAAPPPKLRQLKSHWDFVLEEMAWLANDFAQERIWKKAAAAQISSQVAYKYSLRKQESSSGLLGKKLAHNLANSVLEFWQSVEETGKVVEQKSQDDGEHSLKAYAIRFLKYNNSIAHTKAEVLSTPDRSIGVEIPDLSWEDKLTEENLFYTVPPMAMKTYIKSIESFVSHYERIGGNIQEEVETSGCDVISEIESQDNAYYEDEGETNTYDILRAPSRKGQKKRKQLTHAYDMRAYEVGSDMLGIHYSETKRLTQQSALPAKRAGGNLNVSIPTKRVRTASRRIISPFNAGTSGGVLVSTKTDASSGENNSFLDDQGTPYGGSLIPSGLEVESFGNFEKQFPCDSTEISTKHKKKKKAKHLNVAYEQRWQVDSSFQNEQRDHLRKSYQLHTNGGSGLLTHPSMKKSKGMRQSHDNSVENITPVSGSVPSPVASQMSNMSNSNKFIKILGGRDRGRKPKVLKITSGQPGPGSPWTLFEDQALVVLVHDMGPNWELVSDALNGTMHFKSTYRKAKECKERHNFLMDRTSGDGADSAEDSGSSQPYPSTLPGIPKGSARQLFQRLQGPVEEETIKSHFEKIIIIGQKQHYRKSQDPKQLQPPHNSHMVAISQARQNFHEGGNFTPLDLCDATTPGPSTGYPGQHSGGSANPNQGTATPLHPAPGVSSVLQGSPNTMLGNNLSSSSATLNSSVRDGRYGIPRSASLSAEEQQRIHQYNQMMSSRSMPQISPSGTPQGMDRGVRLLPGGSGMGLVCGVNRSMPMMRHGLQGIGSSSITNSGNMVSSGMTSASANSGMVSVHGSSMLRPREALNMIQPGLSQDSLQQMMVPDLQMQVSPGSSQGITHFGGLSSSFPNQTSPSLTSHSLHHQPPHPMSPQQPQGFSAHDLHIQVPGNNISNPQQQSYAVRVAKERPQHRFMQQQQQQQQQQQPQFAASGQLQTGSVPASLSPLASASSLNSIPQHQQKHHAPSQGVVRHAQGGGSGMTNQPNKQRQRQHQQLSQANRQHPQQRQQQQAQQPSKLSKGAGRGNLMLQQNIPADPVAENGVSTNPGNQSAEKGGATHQMQGQGLYTASTLNAVQQPAKQYGASKSSNQSMPQQKRNSGQSISSAKHINQPSSHMDGGSRNHVPAVATGLSASQQSTGSLSMAGLNHLQVPLLSQQTPEIPKHLAVQRSGQPNGQVNTDLLNKPEARDSDTDKKSLSSSAEMDKTATLCSAANNARNVVQVSSAGSEPLLDPQTSNSATNCSLASAPSVASASAPQENLGMCQKLSSAKLPSIRHDTSTQWQHQSSQHQQPNSPVLQPQQHQPPLHSQQQAQLIKAGNDNLYSRAGEHRLE